MTELRTVTIAVKDADEANAMRRALADPLVHAFVIIVGHLAAQPSDRARARVLRYVEDMLSDAARDTLDEVRVVDPCFMPAKPRR